jgi:hypothetical protein
MVIPAIAMRHFDMARLPRKASSRHPGLAAQMTPCGTESSMASQGIAPKTGKNRITAAQLGAVATLRKIASRPALTLATLPCMRFVEIAARTGA